MIANLNQSAISVPFDHLSVWQPISLYSPSVVSGKQRLSAQTEMPFYQKLPGISKRLFFCRWSPIPEGPGMQWLVRRIARNQAVVMLSAPVCGYVLTGICSLLSLRTAGREPTEMGRYAVRERGTSESSGNTDETTVPFKKQDDAVYRAQLDAMRLCYALYHDFGTRYRAAGKENHALFTMCPSPPQQSVRLKFVNSHQYYYIVYNLSVYYTFFAEFSRRKLSDLHKSKL
jgi:hypothetical protein